MPTVGFLHTSSVHVPTFADLVDELTREWTSVAIVAEPLLARARSHGLDDDALTGSIVADLSRLADAGAELVICTCSTIGGPAERCGAAAGVRVVRVDRPMAEAAVRMGRRIAVVAAIESTIAPTAELLDRAATDAETVCDVTAHLVEGAWEHFEEGDLGGYLAVVADALPDIAGAADVVVLAQASMAPVADLVDLAVPVLSSPRHAITTLLADT